jgi:hypothetical protein
MKNMGLLVLWFYNFIELNWIRAWHAWYAKAVGVAVFIFSSL